MATSRIIRNALSQLEGIQASVPVGSTISGTMGDQVNSVLGQLVGIDGVDIQTIMIDRDSFYAGGSGARYCRPADFHARLGQAIGLLRALDSEDRVPQAVGLFESMRDTTLRTRCHDLLVSQTGPFDRPINQATQIMEDRIRQRSGDQSRRVGIDLLQGVANPSPEKSGLLFATDPSEHQGVYRLLEGAFLSFRNPTHHKLTDSFTREQALQVCAFIDTLLAIIDKAEVRPNLTKPARA